MSSNFIINNSIKVHGENDVRTAETNWPWVASHSLYSTPIGRNTSADKSIFTIHSWVNSSSRQPCPLSWRSAITHGVESFSLRRPLILPTSCQQHQWVKLTNLKPKDVLQQAHSLSFIVEISKLILGLTADKMPPIAHNTCRYTVINVHARSFSVCTITQGGAGNRYTFEQLNAKQTQQTLAAFNTHYSLIL